MLASTWKIATLVSFQVKAILGLVWHIWRPCDPGDVLALHVCLCVIESNRVGWGLGGRRMAGLLSGDDGLAPECMGPRAYHTLLRSGEKLHCCAVDDAGMAPRLERHHRSLWADIARSTASSRASPQPCVSLWWVVYQYCILLVTAVWSFGGWWSTLYHVGSELFLLWLKFWAVQWMIGI